MNAKLAGAVVSWVRSFQRDLALVQVSDIRRYFGQNYGDPIGAPHPWQNVSPAMMRVPHLAQKLDARPPGRRHRHPILC